MPLMRSMPSGEAASAFAAAYRCPTCGAGAEVVAGTSRLAVRHDACCSAGASPRGWFQIVDGKLQCQRGHVIAGDADVMQVQGRRRCRRCHNERNARSSRKMTAERRAERPSVPCPACGAVIDQTAGRGKRRTYCSERCKNRARRRMAS